MQQNKMSLNNFIILFFIIVLASKNVFAQEQVVSAPPPAAEKNADPNKSTISKSISKILDSVANKKLPTSLMYSDEEMGNIDRAVEAYKNNEIFSLGRQDEKTLEVTETTTAADNARSYIYLSSILYYSPTNWSVWINDQKISYEDNKFGNELYIKSINEDHVDIIWTMSVSKWKILSNKKTEADIAVNSNNQVEFNFSLSFNQTYMLNSNKVAEGRIVPVLTLQNPTDNTSTQSNN